MNKEFIPYNLALELKELGFDEPCFAYRDCDWNFIFSHNKNTFLECELPLPLYQQAFRFFHNKYRLHIGFSKRISRNNNDYWASDIHFIDTHIPQHTVFANTYEEAELACLEKLIEIVKENKK
jgi:hypothetical protein